MASVEEIYDEIQFIMGTQGYKMDDAKASLNEADILHTTRNGIEAFGVYDGEKFEVLEGSMVSSKIQNSAPDRVKTLRNTATTTGDIQQEGNTYRLKKSMSFSSPSYAAAFVLGTSANGWTEWKNKDGKTLDELFRK